jgi:outer membrane protein assembly factor BamB
VTRRFLTAGVLFAAASGALMYPGPTALAENWPHWRGPKNDGHSAEKGLPTEFGPDKNLAWKLQLPGQGESTPCVWGDRMFLTSAAGDDVVLMCIGTDGKEKWRKPLTNTGRDRHGPDRASDASASCSTDGKHVWSYVGGLKGGKLTCHDLDGNQVWEKNIQEYGKFSIQFGTHWTPALYKGRLYLQVMHRTAEKVVCLDAASGKQVWAVDRKGEGRPGTESPDVYASAFVWEGEGGPLVIVHGNDTCSAHKIEDGAEVWRVAGLNPGGSRAWRFVSSPLATPDLIVVPSCKNGPTVGVNPVGAKGTIEPGNPAELWRFNATPDVVTPLRVGDIVYLAQDGPFTAVEAKTGKQIYRANVTKGLHRASMLHADGKIYVVAKQGAIDVVQPGREFKLLASNTLPDTISASPIAADGRIYFRGFNYLWAFGAK